MLNSVIIIINLFAFFICAFDKLAAKRNVARVPEKVLLSLAAGFGSFGIFCAMFLFRHKTRHKSFLLLVPVFLVVQTALLVILGIVEIIPPAGLQI